MPDCCESESRPTSCGFRGVKRLEDAFSHLGRHAHAIVAHGDPLPAEQLAVLVPARVFHLAGWEMCGLNADQRSPALRISSGEFIFNRIACVDQQVYED